MKFSQMGTKILFILLLIKSVTYCYHVKSFFFVPNVIQRYRQQRQNPTMQKTSLFSFSDGSEVSEEEQKKFGREMLSYLMTPTDTHSPFYDPLKASRRKIIIATSSYSALKGQLSRRGVNKSGDKEEMLIKLALNMVDPTAQYEHDSPDSEASPLRYISDADLASGELIKNTPAEIARLKEADLGPDADDMLIFRKKPKIRAASSYLVEGKQLIPERSADYGSTKKSRSISLDQVMDNLDRKIVHFSPLCILRSERIAKKEDIDTVNYLKRPLQAYVVGCMDLTMFKRNGAAVVLFPNELGWASQQMRNLADDLAAKTQSLIILPDLFRNQSFSPSTSSTPKEWLAQFDYKQLFDDFLATCNFFYQDYPIHTFSFVGVGFGGGKVLQLANDIYALANRGLYDEILAQEAMLGTSAHPSSGGIPNVLQDPQSPTRKLLDKFHALRRLPGRPLHPKARQQAKKAKKANASCGAVANADSSSNGSDSTEKSSKNNEYSYDEFIDQVSSAERENHQNNSQVMLTEEEAQELTEQQLHPDLQEDVQAYLQDKQLEAETEAEKQRQQVVLTGGTVGGGVDGEEEDIEPIADMVIPAKQLRPDPDELLLTPKYEAMMDEAVAASLNMTVKQMKQAQAKLDEPDFMHPFLHHPLFQIIRGEHPNLFTPGAPLFPVADAAQVMALQFRWPQKELVANWKVTERLARYVYTRFRGSSLFASSPTTSTTSNPAHIPTMSLLQQTYSVQFTPKDFLPFVPRSVVALCPDLSTFNASMVGKFNYLPTRVVAGVDSDNSTNNVASELEKLYAGYVSHRDDILDYAITIFANASTQFVSEPLTDYEDYLSRDATTTTRDWIDIFSCRDHKHILPTVGYAKHMSEAFSIQPIPDPATFNRLNELTSKSFVATWVHDPARGYKIRVENCMKPLSEFGKR